MMARLRSRLGLLLEDSGRERMQLALWGAHRQCLRDDAENLACIEADVAHRWPTMAAWIQERAHAPIGR